MPENFSSAREAKVTGHGSNASRLSRVDSKSMDRFSWIGTRFQSWPQRLRTGHG